MSRHANSQRRAFRSLGVEPLENRSLLAGNVNAFMSGGNLIIEGDDAANVITVESYREGVIQVRGFNDTSGSPTLVNRGANALRLFFGVNGDIVINMKQGNDALRVTNLVVNRNLLINTVGGADQLITGRQASASSLFGSTGSGPLYVNGQLVIDVGSESDTIFQSDLHVGGPSEIDLETGDDTLTIQRPTGSGANVEYFSDLDIFGNAGFDTVTATGLISRSTTIYDEFGRTNISMTSMDIYGTLHVLTQNDADSVRITNTNVRGNLIVDTNGGSDLFVFLGIASDLTVHAGDGNDQVQISSSGVDEFVANLESGSDSLFLTSLGARLITVHGNDGDDVFEVRGVRATEAWFYGDKNTDTFREPIIPPNEIRRLHLFTIERVETA